MHLDLLDSLARIRIEQLTRDATLHRALAAARRRPPSLRNLLARIVRTVGYAVLSLGDRLAHTR